MSEEWHDVQITHGPLGSTANGDPIWDWLATHVGERHWCDEDDQGKWRWRSTYHFSFKDKRDAMLFKLTWGGTSG